MLELKVSSKNPAAINSALKKIKEMVNTGAVSKETPVHILLETGSYKEIIHWNLRNPLIMEASPNNSPEATTIQAENCEFFNHGVENRAIFNIGQNATSVILRNFSIINTHNKTCDEPKTLNDSAETLAWCNEKGTLICENMRFESRQNTLYVKGFSWFKNCYFEGDVDVIYGDCDTALFENCEIFVKQDNRGDHNGFAVKSLTLANKKGFIFSECKFTGEKRKRALLYVCRTAGKGSADSEKNWDSIAFIKCSIGENFKEDLVWDDDFNLKIYPRGNAHNGIREYKTKSIAKNGNIFEADTLLRNIATYTLTDDDYYANYASRYLMLKDTPFSSEASSSF